MTYRLQHSFADGTLRVAVSGDLVPADLDGLLREIAGLRDDHAAERILVDVRAVQDNIGPLETLKLVESYSGASHRHRTAVLETAEQTGRHRFHETAAINRGYKVLHFTDEGAADAWLKG